MLSCIVMMKAMKKKTTKKTAKKRAVKSRVASADAVSFCFCVDEAPEDKCFWVNYGPVVRNIDELREALRDMTDDQFRFHAFDRDINDFAKWVEEVLGHHSCAQKIARAKTRQSAARALASCSDK